MKIKIVGCGLAGITAAVLLKKRGHDVTIFESRSHIGGNCYDSNLGGTLVHNYGPHLFHTNDNDVFAFLSRFTEWFEYYNRPKGNTKLGLISLPYSKKTIREIGRELSQDEIINFIFKDYSEKQWGVPFEEIPKSITNRVPKTKDCEDPTWFEGEKYQYMPKDGYTAMMSRMLDKTAVILNCGKEDWKNYAADLTIYTGSVDAFFDYRYGRLPYRTLELEHLFTSSKLSCAIINQNTKETAYTRIYDHSYFNYRHSGPTIITKEYSKQCGTQDVPFYPIPFLGMGVYSQYQKLAEAQKDVVFIGRLATYTYLDMWMVIKQVMLKCQEIK